YVDCLGRTATAAGAVPVQKPRLEPRLDLDKRLVGEVVDGVDLRHQTPSAARGYGLDSTSSACNSVIADAFDCVSWIVIACESRATENRCRTVSELSASVATVPNVVASIPEAAAT